MLVCAIGDLLLDVDVRVEGEIAEETDTYGRTHVGPGGQAANVAAWAAALGGDGRLLAKRGGPVGRLVADELRSRGVDVRGPEAEASTGTVVSIATPDGRRSLLTDRGVAPEFAPDELDASWLDACEWLHVPGYSLVRYPLAATAAEAAARVARVSVDLSSTAAIAEIGVDLFAETVRQLRPQVVFATEAEAALVGSVDVETMVIKRGARGCVVRGRGGGEEEFAAQPAEVVDGTGAGDAFAAGFLLGDPELALAAAARCVAQVGAVP